MLKNHIREVFPLNFDSRLIGNPIRISKLKRGLKLLLLVIFVAQVLEKSELPKQK
jgi:hypothetical protein